MLGRLIAILRFRRHTDCLIGHAKVMDGDTIVVAGQLVSPHGIDAPELDQTFRCQGHRAARIVGPARAPARRPGTETSIPPVKASTARLLAAPGR
jgi:hypothetical protein